MTKNFEGIEKTKITVPEIDKKQEIASVLKKEGHEPYEENERLISAELIKKTIIDIERKTGERVIVLDDWENYTENNGEVTGVFRLEEKKRIPVIGGKIIEKIGGRKIIDVRNVQGDGDKPDKLSGAFQFEKIGFVSKHLDGEMYAPVIEGEVIEEIFDEKGDKYRVSDSKYVKSRNGKMSGVVNVGGYVGGDKPIVEGRLRKFVIGENGKSYRIHDTSGRDFQDVGDNEVNGVFRFGGRWLPVVGGKRIESIIDETGGKYKISRAHDFRNIGGKFNGVCEFDGARGSFPVIGGEVIKEIDGRKIFGTRSFRNIGGKFNGVCEFDGVKGRLPVIEGKILEEIDGRKIINAYSVSNIGGKLNGICEFNDVKGRLLPVIGGKIIEEIDGKKIHDTSIDNFQNIEGTPNGLFKIEGEWMWIVLGKPVFEKN